MKRKNVIYKQEQIDRRFSMMRLVCSLFIAIGIIVVIVFIVSDSPWQALKSFFVGPFDSVRHLSSIIENATPLLFTGVATCLMFSAGDVVLAGEGALFLGAFLSAVVVTKIDAAGPVQIILAMLCAMMGGALVAAVTIFAKNKFNASPFVFSLLFNYVVVFTCNYFLNYYVRDPDYIGIASFSFPTDAKLTNLIPTTSVSTGIFIALLVVVIGWFVMYKTKLGYSASLIKSNRSFAVNMGINVNRVSMTMALMGGAIAGLAGCVEMLSKFYRYYWTAMPGYGWDGFLLVTLAAGNPINIPFAALFLGYIRAGASIMNIFADVPLELINAIQAVMVLLIASKVLFGKAQQRFTSKNSERKKQAEAESLREGAEA